MVFLSADRGGGNHMTGNGRVSHAEIIVAVRVLCPYFALMDHIPSEYLAGVATGCEHSIYL